ncbi:MAG: hypothetical protein QW791_08130 [Candidatus Bathyarchaeia archaeon]
MKSEGGSPEYSRASTPFIFFLIYRCVDNGDCGLAFPSPNSSFTIAYCCVVLVHLPLTIAINRE